MNCDRRQEVDTCCGSARHRIGRGQFRLRMRGRKGPARCGAVAHSSPRPEVLATVFAGQDHEATARARAYLTGYAPSSPSIALFRAGQAGVHDGAPANRRAHGGRDCRRPHRRLRPLLRASHERRAQRRALAKQVRRPIGAQAPSCRPLSAPAEVPSRLCARRPTLSILSPNPRSNHHPGGDVRSHLRVPGTCTRTTRPARRTSIKPFVVFSTPHVSETCASPKYTVESSSILKTLFGSKP